MVQYFSLVVLGCQDKPTLEQNHGSVRYSRLHQLHCIWIKAEYVPNAFSGGWIFIDTGAVDVKTTDGNHVHKFLPMNGSRVVK